MLARPLGLPGWLSWLTRRAFSWAELPQGPSVLARTTAGASPSLSSAGMPMVRASW